VTDVRSIVQQITLEEKAALCTGATAWTTTAVERLNIPEMVFSDGPHGVRRVPDEHALSQVSLPATCFPTASCLACTWDIDLIRRMGEALAEECNALNVDVLLGPGVNMKRSPLCGRNFEYYSEDPLISGRMAAAITRGVQSVPGVGVTAKHFCCNNREDRREYMSSNLSERALREIYLRGFQYLVAEIQPWSVMSSYNKVNGVYTPNSHDLLTKVLRYEWGFKGVVMTDWNSTGDGKGSHVLCPSAGNDLIMPGGRAARNALLKAMKDARLEKEDVRQCAANVLEMIFKSVVINWS